ncbi:helix-turn-helix domain-containing protein [Cytobacillus gottheilii]|uniref:helix-turn-helix domain-containing protein n=1 Tax=Cytobacillus gottheilii TaxID=859144 RepID=UPI001594D470|nr:helix-turn-helix transcriptional regulator [Cytobacillus gottheilii]
MTYKKVNLYLKEEIMEEIEDILKYRRTRYALYNPIELEEITAEDFVAGCVIFYIDQIKSIHDLSNINELNEDSQLQNKLDELLKQKNISQRELSEMTGIVPSNINNYVKNRNQPTLDHFLRIWISLDCPPLTWLLHRIPVLKK